VNLLTDLGKNRFWSLLIKEGYDERILVDNTLSNQESARSYVDNLTYGTTKIGNYTGLLKDLYIMSLLDFYRMKLKKILLFIVVILNNILQFRLKKYLSNK
jgi:hypothetical protein